MNASKRIKPGRWVDPLSRTVIAATVPSGGIDVVVEPTASEREAMCAALKLTGIDSVRAEYRLARRSGGTISVTGRLKALVRPECIVTLEPFDLKIDEEVDVSFAEAQEDRAHGETKADSTPSPEFDPPDTIENGIIDLGRVTTEFLSLAIPPFPRKPGVDFDASKPEERISAFAALARLKKDSDG